jgi:hypothetical protein
LGINDEQILQEDFDLIIEMHNPTNAILRYNHRYSPESFKINNIHSRKQDKVSEI